MHTVHIHHTDGQMVSICGGLAKKSPRINEWTNETSEQHMQTNINKSSTAIVINQLDEIFILQAFEIVKFCVRFDIYILPIYLRNFHRIYSWKPIFLLLKVWKYELRGSNSTTRYYISMFGSSNKMTMEKKTAQPTHNYSFRYSQNRVASDEIIFQFR